MSDSRRSQSSDAQDNQLTADGMLAVPTLRRTLSVHPWRRQPTTEASEASTAAAPSTAVASGVLSSVNTVLAPGVADAAQLPAAGATVVAGMAGAAGAAGMSDAEAVAAMAMDSRADTDGWKSNVVAVRGDSFACHGYPLVDYFGLPAVCGPVRQTTTNVLTVNCFGIALGSKVKPVLEMSDGSSFCRKGVTAYLDAMNPETPVGQQNLRVPADLCCMFDAALVGACNGVSLHAVFDFFKTNSDLLAADRWFQAAGCGSNTPCAYQTKADFDNAIAALLPAAAKKYTALVCGGKGSCIIAMFKSTNLWTDADIDAAVADIKAKKAAAAAAVADDANLIVRVFATGQVLHAAAQTLALCGDAGPFTVAEVAAEIQTRVSERGRAGITLCEGIVRAIRKKDVALFVGQEMSPSVRERLRRELGHAFQECCPPEVDGTDTFLYVRHDIFEVYKPVGFVNPPDAFAWPGCDDAHAQGVAVSPGGGGSAETSPGGGGSVETSPGKRARSSLDMNPLLDRIPFAAADAFRGNVAHALHTSKTACKKILRASSNFCTALRFLPTGRVVLVSSLHLPSNGEQTAAAVYALQATRFMYSADVVGIGDFNNTEDTQAAFSTAIDHCSLCVAPCLSQNTSRKNRFETVQHEKAGKPAGKWSDGVVTTLRVDHSEVFSLDGEFRIVSDQASGNLPRINNNFSLPTSTHPADHLAVLVTLNFGQ